MKPILILQHLNADGPAYLATWLHRHGVPFELRCTEAGQDFPRDLGAYAALAVLGGEMSANDPLPSLRQAESLIRQAMAAGQPVIGHCLGGQLMARALGMRVIESPSPEVGWQAIELLAGDETRRWFGSGQRATVFQWHFESFELPPGATRLAGNAACPQQAFAIGPHLGMQFHIEVDAAKVNQWSQEHSPRWQAACRAHPASVQSGEGLRAALHEQLPVHQALADRLYATWLAGVTGR